MKNNQSICVSAPGKLLLLGDHAVVYGRPCIVTAVSARMHVTATFVEGLQFSLDAPDVGIDHYTKALSQIGIGDIPKNALFIETAVKYFIDRYPISHGIHVTTKSDFPVSYGFGSSSASVVSVLFALSELSGVHLDAKALFDLAYATVLAVQGVGSGVDVAAAIWGGTLYFKNGGSVIEPIPMATVPFIVGYSGIKADTPTIIHDVAAKYDANTQKMDRIFDAIATLVDDAKKQMEEGDWERVGKLMSFNQEYLRDIGVSTEKLETLIKSAMDAGAWGAKLSGAGGGDCMLTLASGDVYEGVMQAITQAGGTLIDVSCGASGVQIDTTDNQNELLIVVDDQDNIIEYRSRSDCHDDPTLLHRTVGVILTNKAGEIALQKRSSTKDMDAGLWGISAAGHVTKGQTDEEAVHRELLEELGVDTTLEFVGIMMIRTEQESERAALYKGSHDGPFVCDTQEVETVVFMSPERIRAGIALGEMVFTHGAITALSLLGVIT